jgi:hypothetical protein
MLAMLWLLASSHPILETADLIHQGDRHRHDTTPAHEDDGEQDHDAADGKCPLTFAKVSIPHPPLAQMAFAFALASADLRERFTFEMDASGLAPPERAPIPISSWQFSLRAALSPRAPSLLS